MSQQGMTVTLKQQGHDCVPKYIDLKWWSKSLTLMKSSIFGASAITQVISCQMSSSFSDQPNGNVYITLFKRCILPVMLGCWGVLLDQGVKSPSRASWSKRQRGFCCWSLLSLLLSFFPDCFCLCLIAQSPHPMNLERSEYLPTGRTCPTCLFSQFLRLVTDLRLNSTPAVTLPAVSIIHSLTWLDHSVFLTVSDASPNTFKMLHFLHCGFWIYTKVLSKCTTVQLRLRLTETVTRYKWPQTAAKI